MSKMYFILGGARSGKSGFSEELAMSLSERVGYLATGQVIDDEMKKRIDVHKKRRPQHWETYEIEANEINISDIEKVILKAGKDNQEVLIIDCMTNLLFRLIHKYSLDRLEILENSLENKIEDEITIFFDKFIAAVRNAADTMDLDIIIVSNEAGLGLVPAYPLGRIFRDMLGIVNKKIAVISNEVHFFIAGIGMKIK
ncbi:MAG: bifunctional adenosylcobinamide kinase/adenosylcobinamide-phosphate guanylyltransferase [Actinobacteria bacterium]|nr:bifunctional adenosylcobinamide kinase/adenosylcobinamide-phosphate guanylyltransferase [Actinomycetota bacterium]